MFIRATLATIALAASLVQAQAKPTVEVTFVIDTTGSMAGLIDAAKRKVWSIATTIADANPDATVRMGLVAYRDIGDDYVTQVHDLSTDIQDIYARLLTFKAAGGGDWPESVNEALDVAVTKVGWTQGSDTTRIIFLVGDAPPHMDYKQDRKYPEVLKDAAARGIVVNAVQAGNAADTARVWRTIAQMGHGEYLAIPQDGGKVSVIITPWDDEIYELQLEINRTVLPYGRSEQQGALRSKLDTLASAPRPAAADSAGYLSRKAAGGAAVTGGGDLVEDVVQGRKEVAAVPEAELPAELRAVPAPERQAKVAALGGQRRVLADRMGALVKQREAFIAQKQREAPKSGAVDSFDAAVATALRAQIRK